MCSGDVLPRLLPNCELKEWGGQLQQNRALQGLEKILYVEFVLSCTSRRSGEKVFRSLSTPIGRNGVLFESWIPFFVIPGYFLVLSRLEENPILKKGLTPRK